MVHLLLVDNLGASYVKARDDKFCKTNWAAPYKNQTLTEIKIFRHWLLEGVAMAMQIITLTWHILFVKPHSHFQNDNRNVTKKSLTLRPLRFGEPERRPKYELKMFNFQDWNQMKLRAHVLVDFDQIMVMKSNYDFRSVKEALVLGDV